jgi:N12 class adenine-specific DNA methylase
VTSGVATFAQVRNGELEPFQAKPKSRAPELRALCRLRDTMAEVLAIQSGTTDDGAFRSAQVLLNQRYDDYVARFGPISRFTTYETGGSTPTPASRPSVGVTQNLADSAPTRTSRHCSLWRSSTPRPRPQRRHRSSPSGWSAPVR